ncbi:unnamed protein product [Adineta ricciae]|uniref:Uncharacterized protein n=1 Tax=Adineta ricciae TaxID=249248 RepID=A0A813VWN1_ADIRI|nr:unnamed protein product [Adineta ricciae]CAF0952378.1 unnamed protein product [Adineta ricciae]
MVSNYYLLSFVVSCLIILRVNSSVILDERYSPLFESDELTSEENSDEVDVSQRSANFIFPPTSFISPLGRINDYNPAKRQSFGRKHHWDAFFG